MNYLYHTVPEYIKGNFLMPHNELKKHYPRLYNKEIKKYQGRKLVMTKFIPPLNCKWNEVIHLTAVHPLKIKKAINKSGYSSFKTIKWYKISPKFINPEKTTIYLNKFKKDLSQMNSSDQFADFSPSKLNNYNQIPKRTINDYKKEISKKRKPLIFRFIPHILYKGKINIKNCEVIEV